MVRHVGETDFYRRGCNDGSTLILGLVLLCSVVALTLINYLAAWPVFFPVVSIVFAILNMAAFAGFPLYRFKNSAAISFFACAHLVAVVAGVIFLGLLVAQTPLFLSPDCQNCSLLWSQRTQANDEICMRAMSECKGQSKYRFGIFVLFPTGAALFLMEIVNFISAVIAFIYLRKEKK